ncbi:MAG: hypothetical protein ACT4PG_07660 [Panacagrimonas sp.]
MSNKRGLLIATLAISAVGCVFLIVCVAALITGEISLGRPLRVSYRLAHSPISFWVVWCLWAGLADASAYGVLWLRRHWPLIRDCRHWCLRRHPQGA